VSSGMCISDRRAAFLGCEYVIDEIKRRSPIWKKEIGAEGDHWV